MKLISFSGYQSTGKTTATFHLAQELKKMGKSVNLWVDIPRRCPLPINEDGRSDTQWWIMSKMIQETLELQKIYDYVITDRTPFDCVAYEMAAKGSYHITPRAQLMYNYLLDFMKSKRVTILWVDKGFEFKSEKGRSDNTSFQEYSAFWFTEIKDHLTLDELDVRSIDLTRLAEPDQMNLLAQNLI